MPNGPIRGKPRRRRGRRRALDGDFDAITVTILAGLGSTDWDKVEETWNLHRYAALQRHWMECGPPVYRTYAAVHGVLQPVRKTVVDDDFEGFMSGLGPEGSF